MIKVDSEIIDIVDEVIDENYFPIYYTNDDNGLEKTADLFDFKYEYYEFAQKVIEKYKEKVL